MALFKICTRRGYLAQAQALNDEINDLNNELDGRIKQALLAQHERNQFSTQLEEAQEKQEVLDEQLEQARLQIEVLLVEKNKEEEQTFLY